MRDPIADGYLHIYTSGGLERAKRQALLLAISSLYDHSRRGGNAVNCRFDSSELKYILALLKADLAQ